MSILSDREIRRLLKIGRLQIQGVRDDQIQPASVDLTLGVGFMFMSATVIHLNGESDSKPIFGQCYHSSFALMPGQFVLGTTKEAVVIPDDLVARVEGKSSLGRLGLCVHATAGFIDPGFKGTITLEFYNLSRSTIVLYADQPICQLAFEKLSSPALRPYGHPDLKSKYQGQSGVTGSRLMGEKNAAPALEVGDRVFHRRADLFGRLEEIKPGVGMLSSDTAKAMVRYEFPHDGRNLTEVPIEELVNAWTVNGVV